jgi:hypothetical protein
MTDFGRDVMCSDVLRTGRYATGLPLVAQNAYHRLSTARGTLRGGDEEADYGIDLVDLLGSNVTKEAIAGMVSAELRKDERILAATATITEMIANTRKSWIVDIDITTGAGPFSLRLSVDEVTVELLGVAA